MDPRLLRHYNQELQHLREMGAEFAQQFPKIAGRLGMSGLEVSDPYVERLLEGTSFLAARVQLKLDAEFPRFTQRLLEIVYPHYLAPTPAMAITSMSYALGLASADWWRHCRGRCLGTSSFRLKASTALAFATKKRCCLRHCARSRAIGWCRSTSPFRSDFSLSTSEISLRQC